MALFLSRPITSIPTYFGVLSNILAGVYLLFAAIVILFVQLTPELLSTDNLIVLGSILLLLPPLVVLAERQRLKAHYKALAAFAQANNYKFYPSELTASAELVFGSVAKVHDARNAKALNAVQSDNWLYCDFTYDLYRHSRNGDYKAYRVYYGIISTKLPRQLPHVFFDSLKARKRQFRFEFARSQKYSFEGNFDQSFVTYMPDNYKIDTLSFISPEVMLVLQNADDYDIEIVGDRLILLGALGNPGIQVPDMVAKLLAIKKELVDNIDTYRDERLPGYQGRTMVAQAGNQLRGSSIYFWLSVAGFGIGIMLVVYNMIAETVQNITGH